MFDSNLFLSCYSTKPESAKPIKEKKIKRTTARDLLGSDSDEPQDSSYGNEELSSYIYRRVANGYTKQYKNNQRGSHYIDLKIYKCNELENVKPKQRWRKSILTLKTKTDDNTRGWQHLVDFLK